MHLIILSIVWIIGILTGAALAWPAWSLAFSAIPLLLLAIPELRKHRNTYCFHVSAYYYLLPETCDFQMIYPEPMKITFSSTMIEIRSKLKA